MSVIQQNTTYVQNFILVNSIDHISPLLGASPVVTLSKAGGAFAPALGIVSEISGGWYKIVLTPLDTNITGDLSFHITAVGGDNTDFNAQVLVAAPSPTPPPGPPAVIGGYTFNPPIGQLTLNAFSRCQVKRTEILAEHMENAWMESNLLQADWSADGITWWSVELVTQALTQGVSTYQVPQNIVSVLDVYINNGSSNRLIFPFSRTDYASLSNPTDQGFPTVFWYNRNLVPELVLWPTPDSGTYTLSYYAYTQMQDAVLRQGGNAAVPYWWLNAYTADLAYRLARHHAPALEPIRKIDRNEAYATACKQVEPSSMYVTPGLSGYFR